MMTAKHLVDNITVIFFACIAIVVIGVTIWRPKDNISYFENRTLASFSDINDFEKMEKAFCDNAAFRTTLSKIKAWVDINFWKRPVVNGVVVTDDSVLLPFEPYEVINGPSILWHSDFIGQQLSELNAQITEYGGTFLYVAIPCKYAYDANLYPWYLNNRSTYNDRVLKAFFAALERYNVPYLDIGDVWSQEKERCLSSVDHHYTFHGCFLAYTSMMQRLNQMGNETVSPLSTEDIVVETAPNPYLGSYARKLCRQWDLSEPFQYGLVKETIPFTRYNWGKSEPAKEILVSIPTLWWEDVTFTAFMGGDISETIIQTNRPELPSILIYGDSFTNGLETLIYAEFDEMRSLDLRYYKGELHEYIADFKPEYVVCVRDYEQLLNRNGNGRIGTTE